MTKNQDLRNRRTLLQALASAPLVSALQQADAQETSRESARGDALLETVRLRYGSYLAKGDLEEIKRGIERALRNAEALSQVKTTNSDAPDFLFQPEGGLNS
jgi:hypothetical protein